VSEMAGSADCILSSPSPPRARGPAGCRLCRLRRILVTSRRPRGAAPPPRCAPAPTPPPRRPRPRAAPPLPRARRRPPRTPAEARGSGRLRAELQRWPDAKCKCKLLWKPRQASSESGARRSPGRRRIRPSHPGPRASAALRPRPEAGRGASGARHPAPEMPGMQMEQNLFSFCMARNVPGSACLNRLR
jgi:hypothetical protein